MAKARTDFSPEFEAALREHLAYEPETGILRWVKKPFRSAIVVGDEAGTPNGKGYLWIQLKHERVLAHRIAWFLYYGTWPLEIDHWDTNKAHNAIWNLRDVTRRINTENRRRPQTNSSTGLLGVTFDKSQGTFKAQIKMNGRNKHLGRFLTAETAHFAYIEVKRKLHKGCTL